MSRNAAGKATLLLTIALIVTFATTVSAGDSRSQSTFGSNFFFADPPCPAKRIPTFESLTPIPPLFDPDDLDSARITCFVDTQDEGGGVKGVKGKYAAELIVRDNNTGEFETFPVGSGKFKTDKNGQVIFDFDFPSELFADGFESGDVSAWSYTRTDFTNRKKVGQTSVQCGKGASRSD